MEDASRHPTMLVWPANDPFGDVDLGQEIAAHLPDGQVPRRRRRPLALTGRPEGVADLLTGFLADGSAA